jgi:hypothetical protein
MYEFSVINFGIMDLDVNLNVRYMELQGSVGVNELLTAMTKIMVF